MVEGPVTVTAQSGWRVAGQAGQQQLVDERVQRLIRYRALKRRCEGTTAFSAQRIRSVLDASCRNRGADAAIFVTESASLLPAGIGYQQLASGRIAVAFESGGDDTALAAAVGVLRSELILRLAHDGDLDLEAVRQALVAVRQNVGALEQARSHHEAARRSIDKASAVLDEIRVQVLARLGKLEALMKS